MVGLTLEVPESLRHAAKDLRNQRVRLKSSRDLEDNSSPGAELMEAFTK
jgi:hypothetical protein